MIETQPTSDPTLVRDAPPNGELFADVEHDLTRVEQSLADLTNENTDPDSAVAWLKSVESASTKHPVQLSADHPGSPEQA